ncbi:BREX-1 system adenine-specific DNA-methyltransferase PglX, partial [Bacillaceae bacterium CLA-AA-H227]
HLLAQMSANSGSKFRTAGSIYPQYSIDDRAVQLASFAVLMKAREKSRRVFDQNIKPNIYAIQESNWITKEVMELLLNGEENSEEYKTQFEILRDIRDTFLDAKEYGSILKVNSIDISYLVNRLSLLDNEQVDLFGTLIKSELVEKLPGILSQVKLLSKKYDVVCTNPPYMGSGGMDKNLRVFTKKFYPHTGNDLSTIFMEQSMSLTKPNGFIAMINIPTWMYLSSYAEYRKGLMQNSTIINLLHLGRGIFGSDFGTVSFVFRNNKIENYLGRYKKFFEKKSSVESNEEKKKKFFDKNDFYNKQENYHVIDGCPIAYNINEAIIKAFENGQKIDDISDPRQGLATGNNNIFLRSWYEININKAGFNVSSTQEFFNSDKLYAPYNKGGGFRKWYGNCEFLIKFDKKHYDILSTVGNHLPSRQFYFKECLTWSKVTIGGFSMRYLPDGFVFDVSGCSLFSNRELTKVILALMNSKVASLILSFLSPTVNYEVGHVKSIPLINIDNKEVIEDIVDQCIEISKSDWDNYETSWDFRSHPFIKYKKDTLLNTYTEWQRVSNNQFLKLKESEERINQILIDNYKLQDVLEPDVSDNEISINKAEQIRDVKSFVSYAIGCIFGRYSLDKEGLVYAGGEFEPSRYSTLHPDKDNVLPVLSGAYFEDDIISKFIEFVQRIFGEETLSENLDFIADTLGKKKGETAKETLRRYLLNDFYKDHVQTYKKRPIYWLFTSGKQKAFNCLVYMHRYDKTTLSRIRTDYLHEYQIRLDSEKKDLLSITDGEYSTKEISNAKKELKELDKKIEELKEYDELLHHMADMQIEIDLDEGVAVNYEKFNGLVAKI